MARSRLFFALKKRRRLLTVFAIGAVVSIYVRYKKDCLNSDSIFCSQPFSLQSLAEALILLRPFIIVILVMWLAYFLMKKIAYNKIMNAGGFSANPESFDGQVIELKGTVIAVMPDTMQEVLKRKLTDTVRNITGNEDNSGRFIHQRFLITSSELLPGENVMIHHNTKFGKISLKPGLKVEIKGEYAHRVTSSPGWFGRKKHAYGLVHYTHAPVGYLRTP